MILTAKIAELSSDFDKQLMEFSSTFGQSSQKILNKNIDQNESYTRIKLQV